MRHPGPGPLRPAVGLAAALLLLGGCGDERAGRPAADSPAASASACAGPQDAVHATVHADLDGDGVAETVDYLGDPTCPVLRAEVGGKAVTARVPGDTALRQGDLSAVQIPGRTGELVLARQQHPRGGFQARLFGYADGRFAELTAEGEPIFDFVATDAVTPPTAATCARDGFVVTQARAHQPIGVMPAWDVYRTTYTVDGNTVTKGATSEVADNVLDRQLHQQYGDLLGHDLFAGCVVAR
jgi:hypothetical protein